MIRLYISLLMILIVQAASGQAKDKNGFSLLFYNADNLFDTSDDTGKSDDAYLPTGRLMWDKKKFDKRIGDVGELLSESTGDNLPGIIILSGIEKESIAEEILSDRSLRRAGYDLLAGSFFEGSGIIIAAKHNLAEVIEKKEIIPVLNPAIADISTIMYVKMKLDDGYIYHLFLNEWPTRLRSGTAGSSMRMACAAAVRMEVDRIMNFESEARIIVLGSFYEEPTSGNIMNILNATNKRKNIGLRDLYNPFYDMNNIEGRGTIKINDMWQMYDYIIISPALLKKGDGYSAGFYSGRIAEPSESFGPTYRGSEYAGGSGANLPVYIELTGNKER